MRGTGRTTALMLHAIANALEHPDDHVEFHDHCPMSHDRAALLLRALRRVIAGLHLTIDTCIVKPDGAAPAVIMLRSPISRLRAHQTKTKE